MKKFLSLLIAMMISLFAAVPAANNNVTVDRPTETKAVEWAIGYYGRCSKYGNLKVRNNTFNRVKKVARYVALAPLMLLIGTACAEEAQRDTFEIKCIFKEKFYKKSFPDFATAMAKYEELKVQDTKMPVSLYSVTSKVPVLVAERNWDVRAEKKESALLWLEKARELLKAQKLKEPQINELLKLRVSDLKNIVVSRDLTKLCEIKGIADKSAVKIVRALRSISSLTTPMRAYGSKEFIRVQLAHNLNSDQFFVTDRIRKGVSPVEAKAIAFGGDDAIIHVVSRIPESVSLEDESAIEELLDFWHTATHDALVVNDKRYVPLGHGTNAAKECKTLWVLESIYSQMSKWMLKGTNPNWKTTPAKKFAYLCGLQSVTRKSCKIPFMPEDFVILPSVFSEIRGTMTKEFLDAHEETLEDNVETVNRSDGYFIIDIPEYMYPEYINRMIVRGADPEEAAETLRAFVNDHSVNSYRCDGTALKGCGDKHIAAHKFLWANGVTHTPDGRDLRTVSVFCDETVLKTTIGENGAYKTFEDWADAVREEMDLGVCVKAHAKHKKDASYQVIQSLCEASGKTIRDMAKPTIERINKAHTVEGASKLIGKERGHIMRIFPSFAKERNISESLQAKLKNMIDDAFGGKLLRCSYYAFITPDPIYVLQGWFGLEKTGCLEEGEANVSGVKFGKMAFWRSPVMHPNSIRVYNNVRIKPEFRKYFKSEQFVIIMNSKDDVSLAAAADWDGDHGSVSTFEPLIEAIEQTLAVWNKLVIWETPSVTKGVVGRKEELDYVEGLTKTNELGLTVYGLNALLNRVLKVKDPITKEVYTVVIDVSHRGVNFKVFAGNVLVDAGKHGGAEIEEPEESAQCKKMLQPWAKTYRDAVEANNNWRVYVPETKTNLFFEDKGLAMKFVNESKEKCYLFNHLDELASLKGKDQRHMAGTLNKLFALYSTYVDRSTEIRDLPEEKFDFHKLMYDETESRRGILGLIREGKQALVRIDDMWVRPDEGIFNRLAARFDRDRARWYADSTRKDTEDTTFEDEWRIGALKEIEDYANAYGATLEDAYDVITWQMFNYIDNQYAKMDKERLFVRDNLWQVYWLLFGGMAEVAAMRYEQPELDD